MAEVLSQQEIDALLNNVDSGEEKTPETSSNVEKEVIPFDFRLPKRNKKNTLCALPALVNSWRLKASCFFKRSTGK